MKVKTYFTSDWHIGHKNVLNFDNRPFDNLEEMHEALIRNYNNTVPKHGVCYFLGDMGLCSHGLLGSVVNRLNGIKVLIRGNHDGKLQSMYNAGFDAVLEKGQFSIGKHIVTMSHCPLYGVYREDTTGMIGAGSGENWHKENKHRHKYSFDDFGQFHLHGHIHSPNGGKSKKILGRQFDVGVVANNYKPVKIGEIQKWVDTYNKTQTTKVEE